MPADVQMTYGISSVHVQWSSHRSTVEQMIVISLDDVTMIAHVIWGGKYKKRAHSGFGAVIWVSGTEQLGLLSSH